MCGAFALGTSMFKTRIPSLHEFLDGGHINTAVVQPVLNLWHVLREERAVGANGVATQWNLVWLRAVLFDEVKCLLHRVCFRNC